MNIIEVKDHKLPIRLDRYLKTIYPSLNQGMIEKFLRKNLIKVNERSANAALRVQNEDKIQIFTNLSIETPILPSLKKIDSKFENLVKQNIIYEDADLLAINKKANIAVQGGSNINISIDDILNQISDSKYKLVHRLDMQTSGILLVAKSYDMAVYLTGLFKLKKIEKKYYAIICGILPEKEGVINKDITTKDNKICNAVTKYKVIASNPTIKISLVEFAPETGRMHQIRIHAMSMGAPILGDEKYGFFKDIIWKKHYKSILNPKYLYLHAANINFLDMNNKSLNLQAPLPNYFNTIINEYNLK